MKRHDFLAATGDVLENPPKKKLHFHKANPLQLQKSKKTCIHNKYPDLAKARLKQADSGESPKF